MSTAVDLVNLSWCLSEIRQTFSQVEGLLEKQLEAEPDDQTALRTARAFVHQSYGALMVIHLPGAVALVREIEALLDAAENGAVSLSGDLVSRVNAALHACLEYLDDLSQGAPDQALYLFPYFKALLEARGAERIHPADLLVADLSRSLPAVQRDERVLDGAATSKIKQDFETGLLRYLREPGSARGVEYMFSAVSNLERSNLAGANRNFWRVIMAFFDALRTQALPPDVYSRRLLARVNLQLRQTLDKAAPIADRLFRDTLFSLAYAKNGSPIVAHVRKIYELDGLIPDDYETPRYGRRDVRAVRSARDALAKAKVAWDKVMRGSQSEMAQVSLSLESFRDSVEQMPGKGMHALAASLLETRRVLAASPDVLRDPAQGPLTLELATAILFAEQLLEQGSRAGDAYDPQAAEMAKRLESAVNGGGALLGDVPAWLRAFSRAAQERLTMTTFVAETLGNLRSIEKDLDTYFRDTSKTIGLPEAMRHLTQVAGAMTLLGHQDAAEAAQLAVQQVVGFSQIDETPTQQQFEKLAANVAALGFFVEGLLQPERQSASFAFDRSTGEFRVAESANRRAASSSEAIAVEPMSIANEPATVESAPETTVNLDVAAKPDTERSESLLASLTQAPQDEAVRGQLREALESVRDAAVLHDDGELKNKANTAIDLLADDSPDGMVELAASISELTTTEPVLAIASTELPESESAVDTELLEIFLEEANEVLAAIEESQQVSIQAPTDRDSLTTIRRGFHTLKGSSRMVGLNSFGEAGWAMEQVLNIWMAEERAGTPELHRLIKWSCGYFAAWTAMLAKDPASRIQPAAVVGAADAFRSGETPDLPVFGAEVSPLPNQSDDALQAAAVADSFNQLQGVQASAQLQAESLIAMPMSVEQSQVEPAEPEPADVELADVELADVELADVELADVELAQAEPLFTEAAMNSVSLIEDLSDAVLPIADASSDFAVDEAPVEMATTNSTETREIQLQGLVSESAPDLSIDISDFGSDMDRAIAAMAVEPEEVPSVATDALADDSSDDVLIDGRRISRPLYMIFLGEADDLVETLVADSAHWKTEKIRLIDEPVVRAAHSLKGSAALVGLDVVHQIARSLESIYLRLNANSCQLTNEQADTLVAAVDQVQLMLHQFAGGREPSHDPATLAALISLESGLLPAPELRFAPEDLEQEALAEEALAEEALAEQALAEQGLAEQAQAKQGLAMELAQAEAQLASEFDTNLAAPDSIVCQDELDPDLLPIFIEEAADYLPQIGEDLRRWAENPANAEPAHNLMRAMHTVKGSARMAGAMTLGQHVHELETQIESLLLMQTVPLEMIEALTAEHDHTVALFEAIKDPARAVPPPVAIQSQAPATAKPETVVATPAVAAPVDQPAASADQPNAAPVVAPAAAQLVRVRADLLDRMVNEAGEVSISRSRLDNELSSLRQSLGDLTENITRLRTQLREIEIQAESQIQARYAQQKEQDRSFDPLEFDRFTRFQELSRMLAEAVNDVATVQQNASRNLDTASQDLLRQGQLLRELQQNLMRVRMVQIGSISDRMYRVVRQAAKDADKRVSLDLRGSGAEIDRGVLEKMAGPIEHLLRNSVAHGIETRAERISQGKAETGEIQVEVRQEGNEIVLSFSDDGRGLDVAKITARAVKQGLIPADTQLTDQEAAELIFSPGFSTAEKVTELSGRGIGMDVVRAETNALGGRIDIESVSGKGTRFIVHLPLTLAIAQVVMVTAGEHRFAIPSSSVEHVMQLKPAALTAAYAENCIEWQGSRLPMAYLGALIELSDPKPLAQHYSPVVIVRSGLQRLALHVDSISRNQEVVVKNVGPQVAKVRGVAGATVMGNGDIVLIINAVVMAQAAGNVFENGVRMIEPLQAELEALPATIMVVDDSVTVRKVTQRLLSREGYQVQLAKDGVDALRQLQDSIPDVMLVDIEMPRMDGFDLTRHIRADERFKHIPIIMITSRTADKHRNYAKSLGVNVYLGKPFVEEELLSHVGSFLTLDRVAATQL